MRYREFDRSRIHYAPLSDRKNLLQIASEAQQRAWQEMDLPDTLASRLEGIASDVLKARAQGSSVMCAFGAHTIKNGMSPVLSSFIEHQWFTHLATNGAGIIHDWEFAYQGKTSEDVRENVQVGRFGTWQETGKNINLALIVGAYEGRGYGESIGAMIAHQGLSIPTRDQLLEEAQSDPSLARRAAAYDLLEVCTSYDLDSGWMAIPHLYPEYSVQARAFALGVPFTGHPMFGHDIIYTHEMNRGSAVGRTAERDFLRFTEGVEALEGGVYFSIGSSVMSPMIFEKALSMARNVALDKRRSLSDISIVVVDLRPETWDWSHGEPPMENPAYYHRFMKTFNRMGCHGTYICVDNRQFLYGLHHFLEHHGQGGTPV